MLTFSKVNGARKLVDLYPLLKANHPSHIVYNIPTCQCIHVSHLSFFTNPLKIYIHTYSSHRCFMEAARYTSAHHLWDVSIVLNDTATYPTPTRAGIALPVKVYFFSVAFGSWWLGRFLASRELPVDANLAVDETLANMGSEATTAAEISSSPPLAPKTSRPIKISRSWSILSAQKTSTISSISKTFCGQTACHEQSSSDRWRAISMDGTQEDHD